MNNIKYATIVPLVGGMTLGNKMAVGHDPEFLISYEAFWDNDSNLVNYLGDKVPYHQLDSEDFDGVQFTEANRGVLDFVSAVCPCAGLS